MVFRTVRTLLRHMLRVFGIGGIFTFQTQDLAIFLSELYTQLLIMITLLVAAVVVVVVVVVVESRIAGCHEVAQGASVSEHRPPTAKGADDIYIYIYIL